MNNPKCILCLMYNNDAEEAVRFYSEVFPNTKHIKTQIAPTDYPGGKAGDVLTVEFNLLGYHCVAVNGGTYFKHSEAFSFQIVTENQEETDKYWNAIVNNNGEESVCGWCKDKWGISWQITPRTLIEAMSKGGDEAKRVFTKMMTMKKIDVDQINEARKC